MKLRDFPGMRRFGTATATLALVAGVLQGCTEQINLAPGTIEEGDSCGVYLASISEGRRTEINQQVSGAAAGALIGAVLGAAVAGGNGNDRLRGALIGAAAGGLTGFSATYYQQKQANAKDAQALLASVNADANTEYALLTKTGKAASELRKCRTAQAAALSSGIRSGKITQAEGRTQLAALQRRMAADNKVISATFNGIDQRVDGYVDATAATASVTRAQMQAAATADARRARAATPAVTQVSTGSKQVQANDDKMRADLEANLKSIEKLLG